MENKEINLGGINGTGKGVVNTNSKAYKELRNAIKSHADTQSSKDKIKYQLFSLKLQMEAYLLNEHPLVVISSGEYLRKHLEAIQIKHKEFASYVGLEESNLSAIVNSRRKISAEFAFKLGQIFNVPSEIWLRIQTKNELKELAKKSQLKNERYKLEDLVQ
ncbi:MAG: HigA family addiction module antitoxin [Bacteroidota bacterium]